MTGKHIFLDSNVVIYLLEKEETKRALVKSFIGNRFQISTQVVSENVNVCLKKLKMTKGDAFAHGSFLMDAFELNYITDETIKLSFSISTEYQLSYWDSLILASAIENNCSILYSEDLQHQQVFLNKITVINPFL